MDKLADFFEKYGKLHDAVIKEGFILSKSEITIEFLIECMSIEKNYEWVHVKILFVNVVEYKLPNNILEGEYISEFITELYDDKYIFNFQPFFLGDEGINNHRKSSLYLVCGDFEYTELVIE